MSPKVNCYFSVHKDASGTTMAIGTEPAVWVILPQSDGIKYYSCEYHYPEILRILDGAVFGGTTVDFYKIHGRDT